MTAQQPQHLASSGHIGVFPQFCAPQQTTLILQEKVFSFSGDNFSVKDQNGNTVIVCAGKALSFSDKKDFTDASGTPLFSLRTKHLHIHKTYEATKPNSSAPIFTVRGKFTLMGSKMNATFINFADNMPVDVEIKGDFFDRKAEITVNGKAIAQIGRNFLNVREFFGGKQSYMVSVAPGVDLALMAAICICLDEKENEK